MMYSAVIRDYGDESSFEIDETSPLPELRSNQVLVKISASSVNPIDLMKRQGYGRSIFEKQRRKNFPWILGSDFSGHVVNVGQKVTRFKEGDEVWGCTSKATSGTYAEYAAIDAKLRISDVDDLRGAISIGNPNPINKGPITFVSPMVFINLYEIAALCWPGIIKIFALPTIFAKG